MNGRIDGWHENGFSGGQNDRLKDFGGFRRFPVSHCEEKRFPSLWAQVDEVGVTVKAERPVLCCKCRR